MPAKKNKKILITGGAGYIGSHTIVELLAAGYDVVSLDNYTNSSEKTWKRIKKITGIPVKNFAVDCTDLAAVRKVLKNVQDIHAVIHFAALKSVPESVAEPLRYYANNLGSLSTMLAWCKERGVSRFVFSSSCSVYGSNSSAEITEDTPLGEPGCPYAATKQIGEKMLHDVAAAEKGFRAISLRYFNPAGGHMSGLLGEESHGKLTNIVPVIVETATGLRKGPVKIFGDTYTTRDGSCVRDYVHVSDIARAHVLALKALEKKKGYDVMNLGTGTGVTVKELIQAFERVMKISVPVTVVSPRAGDIPAIYASNAKAKKLLGWEPKHSLEDMLASAHQWQETLAKGL